MMKIGYLHIGPPEHGVCRYGRFLAEEAGRHASVTVIEAEVILTKDQEYNQTLLIQAAQKLSHADLVHLQFHKFNDVSWGGGWTQVEHLRLFMQHCPRPLVATLHNIFYPPYGLVGLWKYALSKVQQRSSSLNQSDATAAPGQLQTINSLLAPQESRSLLTKVIQFIQRLHEGTFGCDAVALRELARRSQLLLVCTEEEKRRLGNRVNPEKLNVIPHYVETRSIEITWSEARAALNLSTEKVISILGFIYPTKGHQLLIQAMAMLPSNIQVVFAGGAAPGHEPFLEECLSLADALGVRDRLRVTGYLSEEDLEHYLVATDLGVCPFESTSASGSLSTWISASRPILAFNLPQIAEYNCLIPGAIKTFDSYTPTALAQSIQQLLPNCQKEDNPSVAQLQQKLSMHNIFNQHLIHYQSLQNSQAIFQVRSNLLRIFLVPNQKID